MIRRKAQKTKSAGRVYHGFAAAARGLAPQVREWLAGEGRNGRALALTGHRLGAAVATLMASLRRPTPLMTLGAPRAGAATFAATVAGSDGARIVAGGDVVIAIPP